MNLKEVDRVNWFASAVPKEVTIIAKSNSFGIETSVDTRGEELQSIAH